MSPLQPSLNVQPHACAGELLAIGNVMLVSARNESSQLSMRMPMAIDEFLRIVSIQPPPKGAPLQFEFQWVKSEDHKLQVRPLMNPSSQPPREYHYNLSWGVFKK